MATWGAAQLSVVAVIPSYTITAQSSARQALPLLASPRPTIAHILDRASILPAIAPFCPPPAFASEQIVQNGATGVAPESVATDVVDSNLLISFLGTAAFLGLVILTIGVVYLAVSDFMDKRVRDEQAKSIASEPSTKRKKLDSVTAARGAAKGFGKSTQDQE